MKIAKQAARIILGLLLLVSGLFYFLGMMPDKMPGVFDSGVQFMGAMKQSGLLGFVKFFEVAAGIMLLAGFQVPLALLIWLPINIIVIFFHTAMAGFNPAGYVLLLLTCYVAYTYKNNFAPIFNTRNAWTK